MVNNFLPGALQATDRNGETITIKYSGDIVLEMDLAYRIKLREIKTGDDWPDQLNPSQAIGKRLDSLRLGLLLSLDVKPPVLVVPSWTRIVNPLHPNVSPISWNDPRTIPNLSPRRLTVEEVDSWKQWAILVSERRQRNIDVSIRRVLRAVTERRDPEDTLVDAVVVWENLFGARQETTLRVASSLAWLLAEGNEDRKAKQRQFKKLYELRSGIVHGSHPLSKEEARTKQYEAVEIALSALRVIFRDRPDLLNEEGSEARSNRLLLGD
jgi:hypothetical protein